MDTLLIAGAIIIVVGLIVYAIYSSEPVFGDDWDDDEDEM